MPTTAKTTETQSHFGAQLFVRELQARFENLDSLKILIAGCGSGHEAFYIREATGAEVHSVDIEDYLEVSAEKRDEIRFQVGSVCEMPFADSEFDAVFYYHVIEHVDHPHLSLQEIYRVTQDDGWVFVGTPNRNRLVSSVGAHTQSEWNPTLLNKLKDNLRDWKDRLTGRFHNHLGAHAGFTTRELDHMARGVFQNIHWVTQDYLRGKYSHHRLQTLIRLLTTGPLLNWIAPSIYVWCQKSPQQA